MILLASTSEDAIPSWKRELIDFSPLLCVTGINSLKNELLRVKPQVLLIDHDLPGLNGQEGLAELIKLRPEIKIVVLSHALTDEAEWGLFKAGARGCCPKDIEPKQLKFVVLAVQQGELWIRRTLTCRLLDELGVILREKNQIKQASKDLLANLTQREYEIATLIGQGESNKQIANNLSITERTVKAHLTEIFRKMNVADRLKLSLIVNGAVKRQ